VGAVSTDFFKGPHFGGFRDEMAQPLLVDMAIHQFDMVRYLLGEEPVSVYCQTWNPSWSWYAGDASATAVFEMSGGARYTFTGSWCAPGAETSWNGAWRVSGEKGSALWSGDDEPVLDATAPQTERSRSPHDGIGGSLQIFTEALRTGQPPMGEVHENVLSLAMVEAAVESAETGARVLLDDVLTRAWEQAVQEERHADVRAALQSWTGVRSALAPAVSGS
jgi:predicted dehydrogenase